MLDVTGDVTLIKWVVTPLIRYVASIDTVVPKQSLTFSVYGPLYIRITFVGYLIFTATDIHTNFGRKSEITLYILQITSEENNQGNLSH